LGGFKRIEGIDQEVHRPGMQVAGEDKLDDAFLRKRGNKVAFSEMK